MTFTRNKYIAQKKAATTTKQQHQLKKLNCKYNNARALQQQQQRQQQHALSKSKNGCVEQRQSSSGRSIWHRPKYITTTNAKAAHTATDKEREREREGALSHALFVSFVQKLLQSAFACAITTRWQRRFWAMLRVRYLNENSMQIGQVLEMGKWKLIDSKR